MGGLCVGVKQGLTQPTKMSQVSYLRMKSQIWPFKAVGRTGVVGERSQILYGKT